MRRLVTTTDRRLTATYRGGSPDQLLEPIELETVKQVLRFTSTSEDALIDGWIEAARQFFEDQTSRQVVAALWEQSLDAFPVGGVIELSHPPLLEVVGVFYDDGDGEEQTVDPDTYRVLVHSVGSPSGVTDPFAPRAQIVLPAAGTWPTPLDTARAVRVRFWAGYGYTQAEIPQIVKACLYELVRHFHGRPDGDVPVTTQMLLRMFRQSAIGQIAMFRTEVTG